MALSHLRKLEGYQKPKSNNVKSDYDDYMQNIIKKSIDMLKTGSLDHLIDLNKFILRKIVSTNHLHTRNPVQLYIPIIEDELRENLLKNLRDTMSWLYK